jgi:hypothetical protein
MRFANPCTLIGIILYLSRTEHPTAPTKHLLISMNVWAVPCVCVSKINDYMLMVYVMTLSHRPGYCSCKVVDQFGRCLVRISPGTPAFLSETFHGFHQSLQSNSGTASSESFPIHLLSHHLKLYWYFRKRLMVD